MNAKLTARQERFILEYLVDLNATQAAIRAGYTRVHVALPLLDLRESGCGAQPENCQN